MVGSPRNYTLIAETIRERYPESTWLAHSSLGQTFPLCAIAIATGYHVRVGFEDSPYLPNNPHPKSNAEYIEWAVTMARLHGREPATPQQARDMLGLNPFPEA